jgi:hypothetical protein
MPPQEMTGICNSVRPNRRYFIGQEDNGGRREGQKFIMCGQNFAAASSELSHIRALPALVVIRVMRAAN